MSYHALTMSAVGLDLTTRYVKCDARKYCTKVNKVFYLYVFSENTLSFAVYSAIDAATSKIYTKHQITGK